jgi:hypothetical protein
MKVKALIVPALGGLAAVATCASAMMPVSTPFARPDQPTVETAAPMVVSSDVMATLAAAGSGLAGNLPPSVIRFRKGATSLVHAPSGWTVRTVVSPTVIAAGKVTHVTGIVAGTVKDVAAAVSAEVGGSSPVVPGVGSPVGGPANAVATTLEGVAEPAQKAVDSVVALPSDAAGTVDSIATSVISTVDQLAGIAPTPADISPLVTAATAPILDIAR